MSFTLLTSGKRAGCETPRLLTNAPVEFACDTKLATAT
jgi:hypothetical protein